jgi:hypothetical protein
VLISVAGFAGDESQAQRPVRRLRSWWLRNVVAPKERSSLMLGKSFGFPRRLARQAISAPLAPPSARSRRKLTWHRQSALRDLDVLQTVSTDITARMRDGHSLNTSTLRSLRVLRQRNSVVDLRRRCLDAISDAVVLTPISRRASQDSMGALRSHRGRALPDPPTV